MPDNAAPRAPGLETMHAALDDIQSNANALLDYLNLSEIGAAPPDVHARMDAAARFIRDEAQRIADEHRAALLGSAPQGELVAWKVAWAWKDGYQVRARGALNYVWTAWEQNRKRVLARLDIAGAAPAERERTGSPPTQEKPIGTYLDTCGIFAEMPTAEDRAEGEIYMGIRHRVCKPSPVRE